MRSLIRLAPLLPAFLLFFAEPATAANKKGQKAFTLVCGTESATKLGMKGSDMAEPRVVPAAALPCALQE